jgi:hypothetical protein
VARFSASTVWSACCAFCSSEFGLRGLVVEAVYVRNSLLPALGLLGAPADLTVVAQKAGSGALEPFRLQGLVPVRDALHVTQHVPYLFTPMDDEPRAAHPVVIDPGLLALDRVSGPQAPRASQIGQMAQMGEGDEVLHAAYDHGLPGDRAGTGELGLEVGLDALGVDSPAIQIGPQGLVASPRARVRSAGAGDGSGGRRS